MFRSNKNPSSPNDSNFLWNKKQFDMFMWLFFHHFKKTLDYNNLISPETFNIITFREKIPLRIYFRC